MQTSGFDDFFFGGGVGVVSVSDGSSHCKMVRGVLKGRLAYTYYVIVP